MLWELFLQSFGELQDGPCSGPAAPLLFQRKFDAVPCWDLATSGAAGVLCQPSSLVRKLSAGTMAQGRGGIAASEV